MKSLSTILSYTHGYITANHSGDTVLKAQWFLIPNLRDESYVSFVDLIDSRFMLPITILIVTQC